MFWLAMFFKYMFFFLITEFMYMNILSSTLEFLIKVCVPLHATVFICGKKYEFGYSMIPYIMDVI